MILGMALRTSLFCCDASLALTLLMMLGSFQNALLKYRSLL
jgi:hypothetical protein